MEEGQMVANHALFTLAGHLNTTIRNNQSTSKLENLLKFNQPANKIYFN
jgi:hypothetical protein